VLLLLSLVMGSCACRFTAVLKKVPPDMDLDLGMVKLPGYYFLAPHPDSGIRMWSLKKIRALGMINATEYNNMVKPIFQAWYQVSSMMLSGGEG